MKHFNFLLQHKILLFSVVLTGFLASLLEGLGISFIFPILVNPQTTIQSEVPFPLNHLTEMFVGLDLTERIQIIAVLLILVTCLKGVLLFINVLGTSRLQIVSFKHFRMLCFEQLMKVGMGYYNSKKAGDFHTIFISYISALAAFVSLTGNMIPKLFNMVIYLIMLMILSWKMTLFSMGLAVLASMSLRQIMNKSEIYGKKLTKETSNFNSVLFEQLLAVKVIRLFNQEKKTIDFFENANDQFNKALYKLVSIRGSVSPLFESIAILCLGIIMIVGSKLFFDSKDLGLPLMATFLVIFQRISGSARELNQYRVAVRGDLPSYRKVFQFLNPIEKQYLAEGKQNFTQLKSGIDFKNVSFSYNDLTLPVIKDVSFHVPKGSKIGIVGGSGGGKSTLLELLLRFYDPQNGQILVDGIDLKEFEVESWSKKIGVVSQDVFLFNETLKNNIAYGNPEANQNDIESAARKAHAHEFIQALPQGYDTFVGDRGVLLSGGQKQRIAIARAILIDPEILIFDEATSALDSESEKIVQKALDEVGEGRTVITIAHRLSTIFDSDKIIVMDSGRIVEEGTHQELIQKGGMYNNLIQMQGGSISPVNSSLR